MAKVRVHEVAKRYGISSKEVLEKFVAIGVFPRSASSVVDHPDVHKFADIYGAQLLAHATRVNASTTVATPEDMYPLPRLNEQADQPTEQVKHRAPLGSGVTPHRALRSEDSDVGERSRRGGHRDVGSSIAAPSGAGRPPVDVFICFAEEHDTAAAELDLELTKRGLSAWLYHRDVSPGANYQVEASRAIKAAGAMIVLFSKETQSSRHCQSEVAIAYDAGVPTYPIRLDDTPLEEMEYALVLAQWKRDPSQVVQVLADEVHRSREA